MGWLLELRQFQKAHFKPTRKKNQKLPLSLGTVESFEMKTTDSLNLNVLDDFTEKFDQETQWTTNGSTASGESEITHSTLNMSTSYFSPSQMSIMPIEFDESPDTKKNIRSLMYDQFSAQNIRLIEIVLQYKDVKKHMSVKVDGKLINVNVLKIPGDGNCMFAALVHQIHLVKLGSDEHKVYTDDLRLKVVNHIKENFDSYKHAIKGRIFEDCELSKKDPPSNIDEACEFFISKLAQPKGYWGGAETIRAVSEIHHVNIAVFNERGDIYFPCGFNKLNEKSIFLAYRLGPSKGKTGCRIRIHYDSICTIKEEYIYKFVSILSSKISNDFDCDETLN